MLAASARQRRARLRQLGLCLGQLGLDLLQLLLQRRGVCGAGLLGRLCCGPAALVDLPLQLLILDLQETA